MAENISVICVASWYKYIGLFCLRVRQVKVWFQNRRMKFKRQSRGQISQDGRSNVDSSPRRSADDDDDDDECVDERQRLHGTSTVTSRSGSPAVDSTTTDYCSLATADVKTPVDRCNEPSLLSSQQSSLENDETPVHSSDKAHGEYVVGHSEHKHVVNITDQPATDLSADDTTKNSDTLPPTSVVDTVNTVSSDTQNNLARLEIMTSIAGGSIDHHQNIAGLQMDSTLRPRRGHAGSSRPTGSRCDGRRARAVQSRTRNSELMVACGGGTFDISALSNYRRAPVFDKNYVSECRRESRDITRDLESTLAFPGGAYTGTARCLYNGLAADGLITSNSYPGSSISSTFPQQRPSQSYVTPVDSQFQSTVVRGSSSSPGLHCSVTAVRGDSDGFNSFPHPPVHSATSLPVCDAGWQTWKNWRWNDCASFPASAVDYDDECFVLSGEHVNWRSSVDTRRWTNDGHDVANDVVRTSFPPNRATGATRRSQLAAYWSGDCSSGYPSASNYVMPCYDGSGIAGSSSSRAAHCYPVPGMPPTASSRFYEEECCYMPTSTSLSTVVVADGQELRPCQSAYQSCKYSGVVDGRCRLYTTDDSSCLAPPFVNTA